MVGDQVCDSSTKAIGVSDREEDVPPTSAADLEDTPVLGSSHHPDSCKENDVDPRCSADIRYPLHRDHIPSHREFDRNPSFLHADLPRCRRQPIHKTKSREHKPRRRWKPNQEGDRQHVEHERDENRKYPKHQPVQ